MDYTPAPTPDDPMSWLWLMIILFDIILAIAAAKFRRDGFNGIIFLGALSINLTITFCPPFSLLPDEYMIIPLGMTILVVYAAFKVGGHSDE